MKTKLLFLLMLSSGSMSFGMEGDTEDYYSNMQRMQKEQDKAWEWLKKQDLLELLKEVGPKIEASESDTQENRDYFSISTDTEVHYNVSYCRKVYSGIGVMDYQDSAYFLKAFFDKEEWRLKNTVCESGLEKKRWVRLYKINQLLKNDIKEQRIEGTSVLTTFDENAQLGMDYIDTLFKQAFCRADCLPKYN